MIERELGVIHMALIDAIHAQHPILMQGNERPEAGQPFTQWLPGGQGRMLGVSAVLDIAQLTQDLGRSLNAVAKRDIAKAAVDWEQIEALAALDASESAEEPLDDPFPPPSPAARPEVTLPPLCANCGLFIERTLNGAGKGWRHSGTKFLQCSPGAGDDVAEP